jgi:hypothetical protein
MSLNYILLITCYSDNEDTSQQQYKELTVSFISSEFLDICEEKLFQNVRKQINKCLSIKYNGCYMIDTPDILSISNNVIDLILEHDD